MTDGRQPEVPRFDRAFFESAEPASRIGDGELGGKAHGLVRIREMLRDEFPADRFPGVRVEIPKMVVVTTEVYDAFLRENRLTPPPDDEFGPAVDARVAQAFLAGELPVSVVGDLRALVEEVRTPLAVRSSSRLEDALFRPFAGVYATKMVPNNQPDVDARFRSLTEAVKLVFASAWFSSARSYVRATDRAGVEEKMAAVIQEVVGRRHDERFYPDVSGVGRSYNFFPSGGAAPGDGVVNLALGLGKTIVDGGVSWIYSPARPRAPAPFGSIDEMLRTTQLDFWAVNMGRPPAFDPLTETEYLVRADLAAADYDGTLSRIASTYDPRRDRLVPGTAVAGPRVLDFAPLIGMPDAPVRDAIPALLEAGERSLDRPVEIEFALELPAADRTETRLGFLQLRPMLVSDEEVELTPEERGAPDLLLASDRVMGNGVEDSIRDVVYVVPEGFEARFTPQIAAELDRVNRGLIDAGRPYLLIGFGRWGSSDPALGIPVEWGQIAGARAIVESTLPGMDVEASQGAHFFHNIVSFRVYYLCVGHRGRESGGRASVDWDWLAAQPAESETAHIRHLRLERPLTVKVDGRNGRGIVRRP